MSEHEGRKPRGRELPHSDAVSRLKAVAASAGDAMLTEGRVHPDHELLGMCGEALHLLRHARDALAEERRIDFSRDVSEEKHRRSSELFSTMRTANAKAVQILRRASKMRASTAAGIYAKALIVRASGTGAKVLAMSLAEDMINCPGLRQSLWPAETAEASS